MSQDKESIEGLLEDYSSALAEYEKYADSLPFRSDQVKEFLLSLSPQQVSDIYARSKETTLKECAFFSMMFGSGLIDFVMFRQSENPLFKAACPPTPTSLQISVVIRAITFARELFNEMVNRQDKGV